MHLPVTPNRPGNPGPGSPFLPTRSQTGGVGTSRRGRQAAGPGLAGPSFPAGSDDGHSQGFWLSNVEALGKCLSAVPRVARRQFRTLQPQPPCTPRSWLFGGPSGAGPERGCAGMKAGEEGVPTQSRASPSWPPVCLAGRLPGEGGGVETGSLCATLRKPFSPWPRFTFMCSGP